LLLFLTLGVGLEVLLGVKALSYLDPGNEMRRLLWRLGHAHGALLSLVHIAFAFTLAAVGVGGVEPASVPRSLRLASRCFTASLWLLPGGFLAGGAVLLRGEPNVAVLLAPLGALLLFVAVGSTARFVGRSGMQSTRGSAEASDRELASEEPRAAGAPR
jgi:hypothetical protein